MFTKMKAAASAFAAAGILALAGAAAADAATISGGGSFTGNAGASRLTVTGGSAPLNCTASGGSGSIANGTYTTFPAAVGTIVPTFSSCTGPLGLAFTVVCSPAATLNITGNPVSGVTPGSLTGIRCVVTFNLTGCQAVIEGSVQGEYVNPSGSANGVLRIKAAGQSLSVTSTQCASVIPANSATFTSPSGGDLNYVLTTTGPTIS